MANLKKKSIIFLAINAILIAAVAVMLFLNLYKKKITISTIHASRPSELIELISREFPGVLKKRYTLVYVFNDFPTQSELGTINKINFNFGPEMEVIAFFTKKFNSSLPLNFDHKFFRNLDISLEKSNAPLAVKKNFFVLLDREKTNYIDSNFNFFDTVWIIQKYLAPERGYNDYAVSIDTLKRNVIERIKQGDLTLFDLDSNSMEIVDDLLSDQFPRLYFFHASCSACKLRSLLTDVKLKQVLDSQSNVFIFSVMTDRFELQQLIQPGNGDIRIYLDTEDTFNLVSTIADDKKNPVIIEKNDL